jgi:hypothetical protein
MTTGNGVHHRSGNAVFDNGVSDNGEDIRTQGGDGGRDGGRQLRDIEELVAKLQVVTRQLEFPARTVPVQSHQCAELR